MDLQRIVSGSARREHLEGKSQGEDALPWLTRIPHKRVLLFNFPWQPEFPIWTCTSRIVRFAFDTTNSSLEKAPARSVEFLQPSSEKRHYRTVAQIEPSRKSRTSSQHLRTYRQESSQ